MVPSIDRSFVAFGIVAVLFVGCDLLGADDQTTRPEADLLPLAVENEWIFSPEAHTSRATLCVLDTKAVRGQRYHVTNGVLLPDTLRVGRRGRVYRLEHGHSELWMDPTVPDGGTYAVDTTRSEDETYVRQVTVTRNVHIETPFGSHWHGVCHRFDNPGVADDTVWITFVPGVGPVRWDNQWGPPLLLTSATIQTP